MTNKEAIEILSVIRHSPSVDVFNKLPNSDNIIELNYKGAFDLAIKALEEAEERNKLKLICAIDNYIVGSLDTGDCPIQLTDERILGIGDRYLQLKQERIHEKKDCKDCIHYEGEDYPCDMASCTSENRRRWRYRGD